MGASPEIVARDAGVEEIVDSVVGQHDLLGLIELIATLLVARRDLHALATLAATPVESSRLDVLRGPDGLSALGGHLFEPIALLLVVARSKCEGRVHCVPSREPSPPHLACVIVPVLDHACVMLLRDICGRSPYCRATSLLYTHPCSYLTGQHAPTLLVELAPLLLHDSHCQFLFLLL